MGPINNVCMSNGVIIHQDNAIGEGFYSEVGGISIKKKKTVLSFLE